MHSSQHLGHIVAAAGQGWARWPDTFWLGGALVAASPLSESSESHVRSCRATCEQVGPTGFAIAGRRQSCPSRIRVERAVTQGAAGRGARCPAATGAASGQPARAGQSEPPRRAGGWDQSQFYYFARQPERQDATWQGV